MFLFVWFCAPEYRYLERLKTGSDPPELESQAVLSLLTRVIETELESFGRVPSVLNH